MRNNLIEKAAKITTLAHQGQMRRDKETPYIVHPFMVAFKLTKYNFPEKVIAAALLHDTLEDTDVNEEKIRNEFGDDILNMIKDLSEDMSLPWEERKKQYIEHIAKSKEGVKAISISDKIHNLGNMLTSYEEVGTELWKRFHRGKEHQISFSNNLLKMFKETWKHPLVDEYETLVEKMNKLD